MRVISPLRDIEHENRGMHTDTKAFHTNCDQSPASVPSSIKIVECMLIPGSLKQTARNPLVQSIITTASTIVSDGKTVVRRVYFVAEKS